MIDQRYDVLTKEAVKINMMWALGNRINVSDMELRSGKLLETKNLTMNEI